MSKRRSIEYRKFWKELTDYHGNNCFYCRKEVATTIDHVVPYSFDQDNSIENLVPACVLCNCLASNKHFESVEHKRQYILRERAKRSNRTVICTECLLPFTYRQHSPSLFICAECYDLEYGTSLSRSLEWGRWIKLLRSAGIPAEAHRKMRNRLSGLSIGKRGRAVKVETLIDEYAEYLMSNDEFAELLIHS